MKRRNFVRGASLGALAISTTGFIKLDGNTYVGDCQTTTDILGPFYRPRSPLRNDLVIESMPGDIVFLQGNILHDDCTTPIENAKIELWHCSAEEIYDNDSEEYKYRGTTLSTAEGNYHFRTQMPVPYDAGDGMYRPAHFHLMISASGYQNLITQLYFKGDSYLEKDLSSKAETAKSRILTLEKDSSGSLTIPFNVIMQKQLPIDPTVIDRLTGTYRSQQDQSKTMEYFNHEGQLWQKNELFGTFLQYTGDNTFIIPGTAEWGATSIQFDIKKDGSISSTRIRDDRNGNQRVFKAKKSISLRPERI